MITYLSHVGHFCGMTCDSAWYQYYNTAAQASMLLINIQQRLFWIVEANRTIVRAL